MKAYNIIKTSLAGIGFISLAPLLLVGIAYIRSDTDKTWHTEERTDIHNASESLHNCDSIQKGMQSLVDSLKEELRAYESLPQVLKNCKGGALMLSRWEDQSIRDSARKADIAERKRVALKRGQWGK